MKFKRQRFSELATALLQAAIASDIRGPLDNILSASKDKALISIDSAVGDNIHKRRAATKRSGRKLP